MKQFYVTDIGISESKGNVPVDNIRYGDPEDERSSIQLHTFVSTFGRYHLYTPGGDFHSNSLADTLRTMADIIETIELQNSLKMFTDALNEAAGLDSENE